MFGVYDTGPWLGIKMRGNDFVGWIGGGLHTFNLMVQITLGNSSIKEQSCHYNELGVEAYVHIFVEKNRKVQGCREWNQASRERE